MGNNLWSQSVSVGDAAGQTDFCNCRSSRHVYYYAREPTGTHKWDGLFLHTRHLLESTHTHTHTQTQTKLYISVSPWLPPVKFYLSVETTRVVVATTAADRV